MLEEMSKDITSPIVLEMHNDPIIVDDDTTIQQQQPRELHHSGRIIRDL